MRSAIAASLSPASSMYWDSFITDIMSPTDLYVKPPLLSGDKKFRLGIMAPAMASGLKLVRERAGMTQQAAAEAFGLTLDGYAKIERGERQLTERYIRLACQVFAAQPNELLGGQIEPRQLPAPEAEGMDSDLFERLVLAARHKLGALPEDEARALVASLSEAARRRPTRR